MMHPFLNVAQIYTLGVIVFLILLGFVLLALDVDRRKWERYQVNFWRREREDLLDEYNRNKGLRDSTRSIHETQQARKAAEQPYANWDAAVIEKERK